MKSESDDDKKVAKIEASSSSPAPSFSCPESSSILDPTIKINKDENDCWDQLEDGGEIKDLLPAGVIKNSSKMRFDVKEISLSEDL